MKKIAVLTSSRADFGIYLPLLKKLKQDPEIKTEIIAFGTHLSRYHGYTVQDIENQGFTVKHRIESLLLHDSAASISGSYALTALKFSEFWKNHHTRFDWVLCLGDRFEMAAAVISGIPFNLRFAHLYGGEITIGSIDDTYRNLITMVSKMHIVSTPDAELRVRKITADDNTYIVAGSLNLLNLQEYNFIPISDFKATWKVDLSRPTILATFHPETVDYKSNERYLKETVAALHSLTKKYQIIITMPNADTNGTLYRDGFKKLQGIAPDKIFLFENFGISAYFTVMKNCEFMIGNSSSGIIESASFGIYAINVGNRQKGRTCNENTIHVPFKKSLILDAVTNINGRRYVGNNIYMKPNVVQEIVNALKNL